jgi:hypothetical protein
VTRSCVVCGVAFPPETNPRRITCSRRCNARRTKALAASRRAEVLAGLREAVAAGNLDAVESLAARVADLLCQATSAEATARASEWAAAPLRMVDVTGPKRCSRCGQVKPREAFYRDPRTPDGLRAACRECVCFGVRRAQRRRREILAA